MICFVCTAAHRYTVTKSLPQFAGVPHFKVWSYDRLLRARVLPRATWIFTDLDRLSFWELELAARIHRNLVGAGQRVLNDPATVAQRFSLLRRLYRAGFNRFNVWSVDAEEWPERYPVFLRTQSAHRGALTDLIPDREDRCPREPGPPENDGCPVSVDEPVVEIESERLTLKDSIQISLHTRHALSGRATPLTKLVLREP